MSDNGPQEYMESRKYVDAGIHRLESLHGEFHVVKKVPSGIECDVEKLVPLPARLHFSPPRS